MKHVAAVIGVGFVGRAHVDAIRRLGIPIAGILGSSKERAEESRKALGLPRAYASLDELAGDSSVTAVHVCTPNHVHFEQSSKLLRAGKHVLCEKPLAMDSRESAMLVQLARESKRVGGVAYNLRYYPLCQEAHALIRKGEIGAPHTAHGCFLQDWLLFPTDWNWRLEQKLGGELRAVSDIGTHSMDLLMWLTGKKIMEVCADLGTVIEVRHKPRGRVETFKKADASAYDEMPMSTDDYATILLHFQDGLRGVVTVSQVSAGHKCRLGFGIDGSKGSLWWNGENPNELFLGRRETANGVLIKDPSLMSAETRRYAEYPGGHTEGYGDTFMQLFKDFYAYLEKNDLSSPRTFPTFETGHEEMLLCDAVLKSSQTQSWQPVQWD
ncbi:MAG TPA: Gfo/Idh/MocA family oxidoreductase [Candidatus Acidoferrum sp.]|nr:Gfo/Idh/MocA family oxidoreductase [Candidatus Acidoferrum sp.]